MAEALPEGTAIPSAYSASSAAGDVRDDWLASFDDPGLHAVVQEAIESNTDLRQAAAIVMVARETVTVVSAALWPHVGVKIGSRWTHDDDLSRSFHSHGEYAGIAWELDVWGQLRAERAAAQASYEASALEYAFARQSLAATTAKSWYLAIETRRLLALAERVVDLYRQLDALVAERRDAGKVADLDVAEAGASLSAAEAAQQGAQRLDLQARRALEVLIGRYPDAEIAVAPEYPPVPPGIEPGLPASLLERRPDLVSARQRVLAAFRAHEAAELALLPRFSFSLDGGHLDDGILSALRLNPWLMQTALGVEIPIFEGGELIARVRIASAEQQQAVASYGSALLVAFYEVETTLTGEASLAEQLRYQERALADRLEAARIANVQYLAGRSDLLPVLQLRADAIATEQQIIQLRNAQLANRIDLHLALGGSFDAAPAVGLPAP